MIIYAPFYTTWNEARIKGFILSFNRRYITRDESTCNELYQAAIRAGMSAEAFNDDHVAYPLIIERMS